jgi:hypothetical protein
MIWTPSGKLPSLKMGTDTIGSPMKESGCVKMPIFGREGTGVPSMTIVSCPMRMAGQGVVGASRTSTL